MPYYGHRCMTRPERLDDAWWACTRCLPDHVPSCGICSAKAPIVDRQPGFVGFAYGRLCERCVAKVQGAGPWRQRRAAAVAARRDLLVERYPSLRVVKETRAVTQLEGEIRGRQVEVRLRISVRKHSTDRYVFHVERGASLELPSADDLGLDPKLRENIARGSPSFTQTRARWLRVAFAHLGRLDTLAVLEALLGHVERGLSSES